jgi:adenosylhomocysteine nucleosidase
MIGIICAMDVELEKILAMMENEQGEMIGSVVFHKGTIGGTDVVCAVCGVGKVFAAMCTQSMILKYAPDSIINVGVAGALDKRLNIMDVVVADDLVQHDMDVTALGVPRGMILGTDYIAFQTDNRVSKKLYSALTALNEERKQKGEKELGTMHGRIASGDQFITKKEQKDDITGAFGAVACEMEGAAIAQVCHVNQVPFAVMRAISDTADDSSEVDFPEFARAAAECASEVIRRFLAEG